LLLLRWGWFYHVILPFRPTDIRNGYFYPYNSSMSLLYPISSLVTSKLAEMYLPKYVNFILVAIIIIVFIHLVLTLGYSLINISNPPEEKITLSYSIVGATQIVLVSLIISYTIVYHPVIAIRILAGWILLNFIYYNILTTEQSIQYDRNYSNIYFYSVCALCSLIPLYDFYIYYNNKQAPSSTSSIPAQKGGSSHKKRK
jgi:hypothetical protein